MAETIVSPGVFTRENDQSFLPDGVGQIGAAIVGPTAQGPAFVPLVINNLSEYNSLFGDIVDTTYVPHTVREYLRGSAGSVTVCRVLAGGGYKWTSTKQIVALVASSSAGGGAGVKAKGHAAIAAAAVDNQEFRLINGSDIFRFIASGNPVPTDDTDGQVFFFSTGSTAQLTAENLRDEINANASSIVTASTSTTTLQLTSSNAGTGGNGLSFATGSATGTFESSNKTIITLAGGVASTATAGHGEILSVLFPSKNTLNASSLELGDSSITTAGIISISQSFGLTLSGSAGASSAKNITCSLLPINTDYITKTDIGTLGSSNNSKIGANSYEFNAFLRLNFEKRQTALQVAGQNLALVKTATDCEFTSSFAEGYQSAKTPYITSQLDTSGNSTELFRFCTLADGDDTNSKYKVSIFGLREPADINGEKQYSVFNIAIRDFNDSDFNVVSILETYNDCTLDPKSPNYIARKIGDRYAEYSSIHNKVVVKGSYPNISKLVRVQVHPKVEEGIISPKLSPKGFKAVKDTITGFQMGDTTCFLPSASYKTTHTNDNTTPGFSISTYLGWNFSQNTDNVNWINPVPESSVSNCAGDFNLDNYFVHPSASIAHAGKSLSASIDVTGTNGPSNAFLKFSVPFQGGSDGINPTIVPQTEEHIEASNLYGFDLSSTSAAGYKGYKKAIDILSNQDEYDINMLALPGVIKRIHSTVTDYAIDMVEGRSDAFYIMDLTTYDDTVSTAVNETDGLDTNYAASYYPWVRIQGASSLIWAPPSVIVPGVIARSDRDSHPWFAPAGLNRGRIAVQGVAINLNQAERDQLYESRVNPIANFPNVGACIWGQKTLQLRSSALDRINVRRLLINVKKFIASSSKFLLFEQNTAATRNRFLNIVNPFLEGVQQNQGLFAFRVQMDESNNTADVVDRNQLVGAIYLQPTKTAEFIILDFNVLPTGATFGE